MVENSSLSLPPNTNNTIAMTIYKSKIGRELAIPLALALGGTILLMAWQKNWGGFVLITLVSAFIAHLFLSTVYTIAGNTLNIKAGFVIRKSIDIHTIRRLKETNNLLSSPAASLDRIEVMYNGYHTILVSPENKKAFIAELTSINPAIEVKWKA